MQIKIITNFEIIILFISAWFKQVSRVYVKSGQSDAHYFAKANFLFLT